MNTSRLTAKLGALLLIVIASGSAVSDEAPLPVFDTHVHYSQDAWSLVNPETVMELMEQAGVVRALVSSTPDEGTLMLHRQDASRIVPILRPYRSPSDMGDWFRSAEVLAYIEERLARHVYRGIGEFHLLERGAAKTDQVARLVQKAANRDLLLHVHSDDDAIHDLFAIEPKIRILWAHAGMSASPAVVGELLDRYPRLWTELSLRADDIAPGGLLDATWRALFLRHSDRFMIGTDTWSTFRWPSYVNLIDEHRAWLRQLPASVAEKIAHGNASRLFPQ